MKAIFDNTEIIEKIRVKLSIQNVNKEINHLKMCLQNVINELLCDYPFMIAVHTDELEISNDALLYGACAEYCLTNGLIDEAKLYNDEYIKIIKPNKKSKLKRFLYN